MMVGCDGNFNIDNFRDACNKGWKVATAASYFANGGTTVVPDVMRWIDTTWDSNGYETSLENWSGNYGCANTGGWSNLCSNSDCTWVSYNKWCELTFVDVNHGHGYGCHCSGGNPNSNYRGVICVKGTYSLQSHTLESVILS